MESTPALRFEAFMGPWEQHKMGEIVSLHEDPVPTPHGGYERLGVRSHAKGTFHSYVEPGKEPETAQMHRVAADKFITNITFAWEHAVAITHNDDQGKLVSHRFPQFSFGESYEPSFFEYAIRDERFRHHLWLSSPGGAGRNRVLNIPEMLKYEFSVPQTNEEQRQIGQLFQQLDNLIILHQRKHERLKHLKQAMLQQMFPKPGEALPALRFEGFTEPWEQRKFSDFAMASGIKNRENLPLQSYSVSNDRGFVPQDEQFENGGTMRDADKSMYWIVEPGSFAYNPARINVGSIGYLSTSENVIVSSLYEVFRTDESCDDRFLWHWFKSPLFMKQIEMLQEGGVRLYFFFDKLLLSEIWMPSVEEQRLIGAYFDRLDNLITLHQRKLELLRNLKSACLDKMFV